jgi:carbohydrate diacid regulator
MAEVVHVDLNIKRTAVVVKGGEKSVIDKLNRYLYEDEYLIRLNLEMILIFMKSDSKLHRRLSALFENISKIPKIGVGIKQEVMSKSVHQAIRAGEIVEKLAMDRVICDYRELAFIDFITNNMERDVYYDFVNKLNEDSKGLDLMETLIVYIMLNGEVNAVAKELHIHRNSLNYRLKRIEDITGKDPRNLLDLLELFIASLLYKLK